MVVVDKLIDYILKKYNNQICKLYILIQKGSSKAFNKKYPNILCIEKEDGFFSYNLFKKNLRLRNQLSKLKFDEVYIPSSYSNFDGFSETFMIANYIRSENYILFNSLEEIQNIKLNKFKILIQKYLEYIIYTEKVIGALILIGICYIIYYPYCKLKNMLFK